MSTVEEVTKDFNAKLGEAVTTLQGALRGARTGRADPGILEQVKVDYHGVPTPLHQMAVVSASEPSLLTIKPHERGQTTAISDAVRGAALGVEPRVEREIVRVLFPAPTMEHRADMVTLVGRHGQTAKASVRKALSDSEQAVATLAGDRSLSTAGAERLREQLRGLAERCRREIDDLVTAKENDLTTV